MEVVKSAYCFSFFNEKACNSLTQAIIFKSFRHSDVLVEFQTKIKRLFIIKNGSVRIQKLKPKELENEDLGKVIDRMDQFLVKPPRLVTDFVDVCELGQGEVICEEYFYKKSTPCQYQAVVCSAEALIAEIPFDLISATLSAFEMYIESMKEAVLARHKVRNNQPSELSKVEKENQKKKKRREELKSAHLRKSIKSPGLYVNHLVK